MLGGATEVSGGIQQVLPKLATVQERSLWMSPFNGKNNQICDAKNLHGAYGVPRASYNVW